MPTPSLSTIDHRFRFERPIRAYREMYGDMHSFHTSAWRDRLGLVPAVFLSLAAVLVLGFFLHRIELQAENANTAATMNQTDEKTITLGSVFRKIAGISVAYAAESELFIRDGEAYRAAYVGQSISDPIRMAPGETKTVLFRFKNIGTATWILSGGRFVSAFTTDSSYRDSAFRGASWLGSNQTAAISKTTKPGDIAEIAIELHAPAEAGLYREAFSLAAYNYSWVKAGNFWADIVVAEPVPLVIEKQEEAAPPPTAPPSIPEPAAPSVQGTRTAQNKRAVTVAGGEIVSVLFAYQNIGAVPWSAYTLSVNRPESLAGGTALSFADTSWNDHTTVFSKNVSVPAGGTVREFITFRAPKERGAYTASFQLSADGVPFADTIGDVSITVTSDAPEHYQEPNFHSDVALPKPSAPNNIISGSLFIPQTPRFAAEPNIRVRLWKPDSYIQFRSVEDDYRIFDGEVEKGMLKQKRLAVLRFENSVHKIEADDVVFETENEIRLVPATNPHAVFRIENLDRTVSGKCSNGCQSYRGGFVLHENNGINDVAMEDYIAGIAETSGAAPMEYIKAILTAARTYAHYVKTDSGKWNAQQFDILGSTSDQLYLGYESEALMPRVVEAGKATRGYMVTYDGDGDATTMADIVTTPYYGNSDGRTRSWTEVWGGKDKPWLQSVVAIYDAGRRMFGHGVGMSARDAAYRADKDDASWVDLLTYYYTGVVIEQVYQ